MLFFEHACRPYKPQVASHENRGRIANSVGRQPLQLIVQRAVQLGQVHLGIGAQRGLKVFGCQTATGTDLKARLEFSDAGSGDRKSGCLGMTSVALKDVSTGCQGLEEMKAGYRSARPNALGAFDPDHERGSAVALRYPLGDNADHAPVPALAREDQRVSVLAPGPRFDCLYNLVDDAFLNLLPLLVQPVEA